MSRLSVDDVLGIMGLMSGDEMDIGMDMEIGADSDIDSDDDEYSSVNEMMDSSSSSESDDMEYSNDTTEYGRGRGRATGCGRASGRGRGQGRSGGVTSAAATRMKKNEVDYKWQLLGEGKAIICDRICEKGPLLSKTKISVWTEKVMVSIFLRI